MSSSETVKKRSIIAKNMEKNRFYIFLDGNSIAL